jgi:hypothetical protein
LPGFAAALRMLLRVDYRIITESDAVDAEATLSSKPTVAVASPAG